MRVVGVHGINQHHWTRGELCRSWTSALQRGLDEVAARVVADLDVAYFADLYVENATEWKAGDEPGELDGVAAELVLEWANALPDTDHIDAQRKGGGVPAVPLTVQRAAQRIAESPSTEGLGVAGVRRLARHMHGYLAHDDAREATLARVDEAVGHGADVLIGHSMGSVVAYEWAHTNPTRCPPLLVTMGSPLGCAPVMARLRPRPTMPAGVASWVNVAGSHDPIAWPKRLATLFGAGVEDRAMGFRLRAHAARTYLCCAPTATAVAGVGTA